MHARRDRLLRSGSGWYNKRFARIFTDSVLQIYSDECMICENPCALPSGLIREKFLSPSSIDIIDSYPSKIVHKTFVSLTSSGVMVRISRSSNIKPSSILTGSFYVSLLQKSGSAYCSFLFSVFFNSSLKKSSLGFKAMALLRFSLASF